MKSPVCPQCGKIIPGEDVNVGKDLAFCRTCHLATALSSLVSGQALKSNVDLARPPGGCWYRHTGMGAVVGASHRSIAAIFGTLAITLFWNGIVSVFVLLALSSTLQLMEIKTPEWFPAPKMNGEGIGPGMTIFLWLFLTPFIVIGAGMFAAFLSALAGKTEVRVNRGDVAVVTGIGPVGWSRRFTSSEVKDIRIENSTKTAQEGQQKTEIIIELNSGRLIRFGSGLREERRLFVASAIPKILRG